MVDYYASVVPERFRLLGQTLEPLAVNHVIWLERLGCLPVGSPDQLVTAVVICSSDPLKIRETFDDPWFLWKIRIWRFFLGEPDWQKSYSIWEDYFAANSKTPDTMTEDGASESATPFVQHLRVNLMANLGYSPSESLAEHWSTAIWNFTVFHEINGNCEVVDNEEIAAALREIEEQENGD